MIKFMLFILPTLAFAEGSDRFACHPPDPGWSLNRVAEWAGEMDILKDDAMRSGKFFTKFGNPVDESCWKGLTKEQWEKRLARMEEGIAHAVTQAQRCWSTLRFASTNGIITKIRRTTFNCKLTDGKLAASASYVGLHAPTADHTYELHNWGEYMDQAPMDWVGSTLFHEVLHWSVDNNRSWHNHTSTRNKKGCNKSLFEDRVYLAEASCFPHSDVGELFYDEKSGASQCADVCKKSLTESDPDTIHWARRAFQGGTQALHGYKYTPEEAQLICDRIKNVPKKYKASRESEKVLRQRTTGLLDWGRRNFGDDRQGRELREAAKEAFGLADNAYDPDSSLPGIKRLFPERKAKFVAAVRNACANPLSMTIMSFCKLYTPESNPVTNEMTRIETELQTIDVDDFSLYKKAKTLPKLEHKKKF